MKPNEGFNKVQELLLATSYLLRNPRAWTRRAAARDRAGDLVDLLAPHAVSWCITGGIQRAAGYNTDQRPIVVAAESYVRNAIQESSIPQWNDRGRRTHQEVQEALLRAVVLAGEWVPV